MFYVSYWVTFGTTVVQAAMKFIHSSCDGIIPIDEVDLVCSANGLFAAIANVLDSVR